MELFKYVFIIIASVTLFSLFGGMDPNITIVEMFVKAVMVGLVFATVLVLREVKTVLLNKIS